MLEGAKEKKTVFIQNYVQVMRRCRPYMVQKEVSKTPLHFYCLLFTLTTIVLVVVTRTQRTQRSEENDDDDGVEVTASDHEDRSKELGSVAALEGL